MNKYIHQNFLKSAEEYQDCIDFWDDLMRSVAKDANQEPWTQWQIPISKEVPIAERDGDVIYDAKSVGLNRGFSILQHSVEEGEVLQAPFVTGWLKHYDDYQDIPRFPVYQVVISVILSEGAIAIVKIILAKLFNPKTTRDDMAVFVHEQLVNQGILDHVDVRNFAEID